MTVLRLASLIGPTIDTPLARYLAMPFVPTSLGFDPRLQLLHEDDAVEVLRLGHAGATCPGCSTSPGTASSTLSQAMRRAGRMRLPLPRPRCRRPAALVRNSGALELSAEQAAYLNFGRVVDTGRIRRELGFVPRYTTAAALEDYLSAHPSLARLGIATVWALQSFVERLAASRGSRVPALAALTAPSGDGTTSPSGSTVGMQE